MTPLLPIGGRHREEGTMPESVESEEKRRLLTTLINEGGVPADYDGPLWDTEEMQRDFVPIGFAAPFIVVDRREDGQRGTLTFTHSPRVYFNFVPVS
jgi:hypothetical protein